MTDLEIVRLMCERVMGWQLMKHDRYRWRLCYIDPETRGCRSIPDFPGSLDACAIAEAEIERRGMDIKYYEALWAETRSKFGTASELHWADVWAAVYALMQSTPLQRCLAMLRACGVDAL